MANDKTLAQYFDISVRQQLETQFKSSPHDKFFLFSSVPTFAGMSSSPAKDFALCPLLYSNTFNAFDPRIPGSQVGSLGTAKTMQLSSPGGGPKSFQIGSFAVITGNPNGVEKEIRWTLAKKLFYPLIMGAKQLGDPSCQQLLYPFLRKDPSGGTHEPGNTPFKVIAADINDIFSNFGESEFYDIPFGLIVIAMTKGNDFVSGRFLEMCKLGDQGPMLQAMLNNPSIVAGAQGVTGGYTREYPLSQSDITGLTALGGSANASFLEALLTYAGVKPGEQ